MTEPATSAATPAASASVSRFNELWQRLRPWLLGAIGLAIAVAVGVALRRLLLEVRYADVVLAVASTSKAGVAAALLATAVSYLALTQYDFSALRYAGAKVARGTVLLTSFLAYALSNSIGLGPLSGGAVRMRLYAAAGLDPALIARVIVFNAAAFSLGMAVFGAFGLLWAAHEVAPLLRTQAWVLRVIAAVMLAALCGFLWLCSRRRELYVEFVLGRRWSWSLRLPPLRLALRQLVTSAFELAASAAALWFLLPAHQIAPSTFAAFYAVAIVAAIVSHVPGGVGVFEAVMMLLASGPGITSEAMLGALLLYRGIYYLLPLVLATGALAVYELKSGVAAPVGRIAVHLSPRLLAALALIAGVWLMVSGVTPFTADVRAVLAASNVPLPLIEAAHFFGSVAGIGLLLVARGLLHQLDAAWWAALGLSIVAAVLALPKGIALNEAALLLTLSVLLVISRKHFDRRSSLFAQHLAPGWLLALGAVIVACTWVLFFAYQEVGYSHGLWWQFELDGEAARSLRALLGAALVGLAYAAWQLLRSPAVEVAQTSEADLARVAAIVRADPSSDACLALVGDKHLLFSPSGRSFLMFGRQGRTWVSLHGPFGDSGEWADLVWRFIEVATDHGGRAAFYRVRPAALPLYLDCGLQAFKLGEYAQVSLPGLDLTGFDLKDAGRADLRSGERRAEREGEGEGEDLSFEVIEPGFVAAVLAELRQVSDAWLAAQRGREMGFSVGRFDTAYLLRLPVAVVRHEGRVIAFANLLVTDAKDEARVDLMRCRPDAPPGTMDFLVASIVLTLQARGHARFGLGMSPIAGVVGVAGVAGMAERRKAPRWQRLGRILFEYGDRFYDFRGRPGLTDKFDPVWEARYLAAPGGLAPARVLADVAALIGGGDKAVIAK